MYILDSSVLIAVVKSEPGSERLLDYFDGSLMCAINQSEVLQKVAQLGRSIDTFALMASDLDYRVVSFDAERAAETAALWPSTKEKGLSLADRSCLSLAAAMDGIAVTTDRAWGKLDLPGINVLVIER